MFVSGWKYKHEKLKFPLPSLPSRGSVVPVKKNTNKKEKKEQIKKEKNKDTTQTKLNALHVKYNVKIVPR